MKVLIENGAQVNARDKQGRTPLYYASNYSTADSVRLLLENEANINVFDINSKSSALHGIDDEEKIKVLIEFGANVNAINDQGWTALHSILSTGTRNCAKILIDNGADLTAKDNEGQSPLFKAAKEGNVECVQLLIENKANVNEKDKDGQTPLLIATKQGFAECLQLLIESNANDNETDKSGRTALQVVEENLANDCENEENFRQCHDLLISASN